MLKKSIMERYPDDDGEFEDYICLEFVYKSILANNASKLMVHKAPEININKFSFFESERVLSDVNQAMR